MSIAVQTNMPPRRLKTTIARRRSAAADVLASLSLDNGEEGEEGEEGNHGPEGGLSCSAERSPASVGGYSLPSSFSRLSIMRSPAACVEGSSSPAGTSSPERSGKFSPSSESSKSRSSSFGTPIGRRSFVSPLTAFTALAPAKSASSSKHGSSGQTPTAAAAAASHAGTRHLTPVDVVNLAARMHENVSPRLASSPLPTSAVLGANHRQRAHSSALTDSSEMEPAPYMPVAHDELLPFIDRPEEIKELLALDQNKFA